MQKENKTGFALAPQKVSTDRREAFPINSSLPLQTFDSTTHAFPRGFPVPRSNVDWGISGCNGNDSLVPAVQQILTDRSKTCLFSCSNDFNSIYLPGCCWMVIMEQTGALEEYGICLLAF